MKATAGLAAISSPDDPEMRRLKAQDALDTILKASKHSKDRELMRDVKRLAKEKAKRYTNFGK